MQKSIPVMLVLVILASGCLQPQVENQENLAEYKHPDSGFTMKYPESWKFTDRSLEHYHPNHSRIVFTSPDNQATFMVDITLSHHPEGEELGGVAFAYDGHNATFIASRKNVNIAGLNGTQWILLVQDPDREYYDDTILLTQICPGLQNNMRNYSFQYNYTAGDPQLEETVNAMLDSIQFACSSEKLDSPVFSEEYRQ